MDLEDAIAAAGEGGTIRRDSWQEGRFLVLAHVRWTDTKITLKVGEYIRGDGFNVRPPSIADKRASDWSVMAKAVPLKPRLRLVRFEDSDG